MLKYKERNIKKMSNKLGELVKLAKGNERTIREYARDSGVDPAIISKIISGKYIPKKPNVLAELTSVCASPRNGVTYEKLVSVAQFETSYKAGLIAASTALSAIGGLPMVALTAGISSIAYATAQKGKEQDVLIDKKISDIQRFSATAIGLIYGKLAQNAILFKPEVDKSKRLLDNEFDTYLTIEGQLIEEYVIGYLYLDEEECKTNFIVENMAQHSVERFLFLKSNKKRKISIVVNNNKVYEYLLKFKGNLSYRGYLSIILVDMNNVSVEKEDYISWYEDNENNMPISIM